MNENKWKRKRLYHYTSFPVLDGIINKGELWLCNVKSMNDTKEMFHYMECLEKSVCKAISYEQKEKVHKLFDMQLKKLKNQPVFASSFSRVKDDAAQWERYASSGEGVCLAFDAEQLEQICRSRATLQTVFYTKHANKSIHTSLIKDYILTGVVNTNEWSGIDSIFENSWVASSAYKHASFKNEKEVRVVSLPFSMEHSLGKTHYKMESWGIREYYILDLKENEEIQMQDLVKEIIIGPRSKVTVDTVQRYLENLNSNFSKIKVSLAKCPLR